MLFNDLLDALVAERRRYRRAFLRHHGLGPWSCHGCGGEVTLQTLNVHHLDEDHMNEDADNLVPIHRGCHGTLHGKKNDMSLVLAARWSDPAAGRRHAEAMHRVERVPCDLCGRKIMRGHMDRHRGSAQCKTIPDENNYALARKAA